MQKRNELHLAVVMRADQRSDSYGINVCVIINTPKLMDFVIIDVKE